jgi:hypothetical protein
MPPFEVLSVSCWALVLGIAPNSGAGAVFASRPAVPGGGLKHKMNPQALADAKRGREVEPARYMPSKSSTRILSPRLLSSIASYDSMTRREIYDCPWFEERKAAEKATAEAQAAVGTSTCCYPHHQRTVNQFIFLREMI